VTDPNTNYWQMMGWWDNGTDILAVYMATLTAVSGSPVDLSISTAWTGEMTTQVLEIDGGGPGTWYSSITQWDHNSGTSMPYIGLTQAYQHEVWIGVTNASGGNPTVSDPNPYEGWGSQNNQLLNYNLDLGGVSGYSYTAVAASQDGASAFDTFSMLIYFTPSGGSPAAPSAPVLQAPSPSLAYDYNAGYDFYYTYITGGDGPELYYQMRLKQGSNPYGYFNGTDFSSSTPVNVASVNGLIEVPSGLIPDGFTYDWSVASVDAGGTGPFAADESIVATSGPAVSVSTGSTLSGNTEIDWSVTFGGSGSQAAWQVITYSADQVAALDFVPGVGPNLDDSGYQTANDTLYTLATPVPNGTVCTSYVFITQTPGLQVGVGNVSYTISDGTAPSQPTISAVLATDPTTGVPAIMITVNDPDLGGDPAVGVIIIRDDATSLTNANYSTPGAISGTAVFYDLEIAADVAYQYYAVTVDAYDVFSPQSDWTTPVSVAGVTTYGPAIPAFYMWIPSAPGTVLSLHLASKASGSTSIASGGDAVWVVDRPEDQGIFQPFGRPDSVVVRGDMRSEQFDLDLVFLSQAEWNAFDNMRNQQKTVALRSDMSATIGYYALGGTRPAAILRGDRRTKPIRQVTITCTPVAKP
jgi:hypothetical protein